MENEELDGLSMDIAVAEREKLHGLFPQCFIEGRLDERKLLELLGTFNPLDENDREKYEFRWKGKQEALQLAAKRSAGTLRPCPEESVDWENTRNLYIEGDNLEVLKLLQTSYYRKVKMIYIDPPYNTGNDFVYADDFADPLARYREVTQQTTKSNPESMGRFHTNWLNMMLPRLRLAANLLRDDGVIFISIDDTEIANLRRLCDEIFGEENFIANVVWQRRTSPDARKKISTGHEYILIYCKSLVHLDDVFELLTLDEKDKQNYTNPDNDPRGGWVSSDFTAQGFRPNQMYEITTPSGAKHLPPEGRCWKNDEGTYKALLEDGRLWFGSDGTGVPRQKNYLSERKGKTIWTWWSNTEVGHTQEGTQEAIALFGGKSVFDYPKPSRLIRRMLQIATKSDDIILDFFSGSATTAHAVMQLNAEDGGNRRFILVQIPEICDENSEAAKVDYMNICEIGKERIRRVGTKIVEEGVKKWNVRNYRKTDSRFSATINLADCEKPDIDFDSGFRVFKLDSSNLKQWDSSPVTGENAVAEFEQRLLGMLDILKPDRSDVDVVYEVMLKLGQDLCEPICAIELPNERQVYGVGADMRFIVCLAPNVTVEDAAIMAGYAPERVVFADRCFDGSEAKSNVRLTLRDKGIGIRVL
ncbi:MAG: site-specific DNA-methyltransferase [Clostridia bacterium]|nr:site-specific DNA-methyltransferase [Clostridia bacterium]